MKRIAVAFLGNLFYDTRTYNLFHSLRTRGHAVHFYGFDWETPGFQEVRRPDICIRKLRKRRFSILFYIRFAWGTAAALMRNRSDIYIASDFFTLAFCTLAARYWHADLVYDSREVYSEMPGIYDKPLLKRLVLWVERLCAPSAACVLATGEMDAEFIRSRLGIRQVRLLRNLPQRQSVERVESYRGRFPTPVKGTVLIYQGILVPGRGIETMLEVLQKMPSSGLVILGEGVMSAHYKRAVSALGLEDRVFFAGKIP
ncbi:MAG TPA: glycosyltransferase, partial [bacterium]